MKYSAFGEIRDINGTSPTDYESKRCFNCGICNQCDNCYNFCPDIAVVRDNSEHGRHINFDYCKGCGVCVTECPGNAMLLMEE